MSDLVKESKELLEILRTAPKTIRTNKLSYDDTWNDWDNEEDEEDKLSTYEIVGEDEADIHQGKVSYLSPLAEALIGAKLNDEVTWEKPMGDTYLTIQKIEY